jgi:hypothetical protein
MDRLCRAVNRREQKAARLVAQQPHQQAAMGGPGAADAAPDGDDENPRPKCRATAPKRHDQYTPEEFAALPAHVRAMYPHLPDDCPTGACQRLASRAKR